MSDAEALAFLAEERTVVCATAGRDGWPHLMPLWYVLREGQVWAWTYARSQKVRNLERDPRATLQVEAGAEYQQLRGVMVKCDVTLHRDPADVAALGREIFARHGSVAEADLAPEARAMVEQQATKRVGLQFVAREPAASWDHRKLAPGVY